MEVKTERHKVVIVGAGPAGSTASIFLSKAGIPHLLIDKATFPRDKICGDALSGKVIPILRKMSPELPEMLSVNSDQFIGSYGIRFSAPNGKYIDIPFDNSKDFKGKPPGFISKRIDFDNFLFKRTSSSFCEIREQHSLKSVKRIDNELELEIESSEGTYKIITSQLISSEGDRSITAKTLGGYKMEPAHYCAGIRTYYEGITEMHEHNFIELHFLKEMLPGYLWIFPLPNGMANVGAGMLSSRIRNKKADIKKQMQHAIAHNPKISHRFKNARIVDPVKGWGLPLGSKKRPISGSNYLLTGDAASLIDPFTGEGISNAMYCGMIGAEITMAAIAANDFSAKFLKEYDNKIYHRLWDELRLSKTMQDLSSVPWLFNFVVNRAQKNKTLQDTISCMFDDLELRSRLRNPAFYLKLLFNL